MSVKHEREDVAAQQVKGEILAEKLSADSFECDVTILENVTIDPDTRRIDLTDCSLTENTRGVYPISHIPNALRQGIFDHPKNLIHI